MIKPIRITARNMFSVLLSLSLVTAGLCLIGGCLYIYFGEGVYSRELVSTVFAKIAVPVWIAVGLTVISLVWDFFAPADEEYQKAPKAYARILARLYQTRNTDEQADRLRAEQRVRKVLSAVRLLLVLAGLLVFFGYAVQPANYTEDINASVIRAMWVAIPCAAVPMIFSAITARSVRKSYESEIALLQACPVVGIAKEEEPSPAKAQAVWAVIRIVLSVLAAAALIYGFATGGTVDVLTKAINICTECIGLG